MPRTLAGMLARLLHPAARRRPDRPFRFSHAAREAGRYATDFGAWQPMVLAGDPPVEERTDIRRARRVHDAILPLIPERAEMARRCLLDWEAIHPASPLSEPEDWERIEYALARRAEMAAGPDRFPDDARPRLRPRFHAVLVDLCCLGMISARRVRPEARVVFENDLPSRASPRPACFPLLAEGSTAVYVMHAGSLPATVAPGEAGERTSFFSVGFTRLKNPPREPTPDELEAELHDWLDRIVEETGALPDRNEVAAMMVEARIPHDDIPASVLKRMIDAERTRGR